MWYRPNSTNVYTVDPAEEKKEKQIMNIKYTQYCFDDSCWKKKQVKRSDSIKQVSPRLTEDK